MRLYDSDKSRCLTRPRGKRSSWERSVNDYVLYEEAHGRTNAYCGRVQRAQEPASLPGERGGGGGGGGECPCRVSVRVRGGEG